MVAMALAGRPDLIVFDEPTTALDVTTQIEVLAAIRKVIRDHGTAALYISHDLAVVAQVADRILVLRYGKMVETGADDADPDAHRARPTPRRWSRPGGSTRSPRARAEPPLLEVRAVCAAYGGGAVRVLEDIDVAVPARPHGGGRRRERQRQEHARPRHHRPPAAAHGRARASTASRCRPALAARGREQLRRLQLIHQMPDVALNPRQRVGEILGRPLAALPRPARPAAGATGSSSS